MDERDFEELLASVLEDMLEAAPEPERDGFRVESFEDAGLLTTNRGLVVRIRGQEFQLTIVRSR